MPEDYDIVKELRKAEKIGVFDSKTMNPPIDYELDVKNDFEDDYQTEGFFKDETNHQVPRPSVLDLIFASTPLPFLFKNNQGIYTLVNDAACRFLGKSRNEIIGNSDFELFPKDEAKRFTLIDKKLIATGESNVQQTKITCKNMKRWVKISKTPVKHDGIIIGVLCYFLDVQGEKNLIDDLKENTAEYGSLFDHINYGFAYHEIVTDKKGNPVDYVFLDVNSSFEKMTCLKKKDILGKKVTEVLKGIENDPADWISNYGRVALHNEIVKFENYSKPLDKWYHVHAYSPHEGFFVTIFENITSRKQMEEKLHDKLERQAGILKGTNFGTWEWNVQTGETIFNERWAEIIGYTLKELSPVSIETWIKLCHPDDLKTSDKLLEKHFQGDLDYYECEVRMKHKNGDWIWVLDKGRVITWADDGKPLMMMGMHQDITNRKLAEKTLKKNEVALQAVLDSTADGILTTGKDKTVLYANNRFNEMWQIPPSVMNSRDDDILLQHVIDQLVEPDEFLQKIKKLYASDEKSFDTIYFKDGRIFERLSCPLLNKTELLGRVWSFHDITKRKKIERALQESRNLLQSTFESIQDGISVLDPDLTIRLVNNTIKTWHKQELPLVGKKCFQAYQNRNEPCNPCPTLRCIQTKKLEKEERKVATKEGKKWIELFCYPLIEQDTDTISGAVKFVRDITARKQAENEVMENLTRLNELAEQSRVIIWEVDANGLYTYVSQFSEKIIGYPAEELIGKKHFYDLHPKKGRETFKNAAFKVFERKDSFRDLENPIETKDGRLVWVSTTGIPLLNPDDTLRGYRGSDTDLTNRKKTEETIKENEEKLNTFFSQSLDGFFFMMLDEPIEWNESVDKEKTLDYVFKHQRMTKVNQAMLDQYQAKEEDFIGSTPYDLFKHDLDHGRYIWRGLFDRGRWHVETNERRKDGSEMWLLGDYICMYDSKGRITGYFGIQTDITRQKKTKLELQEKINALERYKKVTVDRELKMIELKKEINKLKKLLSKSNQ